MSSLRRIEVGRPNFEPVFCFFPLSSMTIPVGDIEPVKCTIIGASLEGLTCAYLLHKAGHQVLVVDKASRDRRVRGK